MKTAIKMGALLGFILALAQIIHLEATPSPQGPTFSELINSSAKWPMRVMMMDKHTVHIIEKWGYVGRVEINHGVFINAKEITDDGILIADWADTVIRVPMDKTDLVERLWGRVEIVGGKKL